MRQQISKRTRFRVLRRDGFACTYCGASQASGATLHVDHVVPVAKGGGNEIENLVAACADCNLGKGVEPARSSATDRGVGAPTWGLSFKDNGRCHWQFEVVERTNAAVRLITFSWLTGGEWSVETVAKNFLAERCLLFTRYDEFIAAAAHWGDLRAGRVNPAFVSPTDSPVEPLRATTQPRKDALGHGGSQEPLAPVYGPF